MKTIFDNVSYDCSKIVTKSYSTSFSLATKMLAPSIRADIYNIYGFVRFADEIVDSFHDYDKAVLFARFEQSLEDALTDKIHLNPILNAFINSTFDMEGPFVKSKVGLFKSSSITSRFELKALES